jgi:hypothetical protein
MMLLRRLGRERQAVIPTDEARAVMRLLYDDFATHCSVENLTDALEDVLDKLDSRASRGGIELLPLPTGTKDLHRLRPLFRYTAFTKYYKGEPDTVAYLESGIAEKVKGNPRFLDDELARIETGVLPADRAPRARRLRDFDDRGGPAGLHSSRDHPRRPAPS